ncbi:MAG TPA: glycosyltransferase [Solirubrobacteraceae bacterium]|nr:glycosyltransferase [Solirubrobacteraceae bacterium]
MVAVVAARDEAERIEATLAGLAAAFPQAAVWVVDDGSRDATAQLARDAGARVLRNPRPLGKGAAVTAAARGALAELDAERRAGGPQPRRPVFVLCDADLAGSAGELGPLVEAVLGGEAQVAVGVFAKRLGGGLGLVRGFARWAIRRCCGLSTRAPISGQRALDERTLRELLPFADGYGIELAMTIDAVRAGRRVLELELELEHRVSGRTPAGFLHRARQLADCARAYAARR